MLEAYLGHYRVSLKEIEEKKMELEKFANKTGYLVAQQKQMEINCTIQYISLTPSTILVINKMQQFTNVNDVF